MFNLDITVLLKTSIGFSFTYCKVEIDIFLSNCKCKLCIKNISQILTKMSSYVKESPVRIFVIFLNIFLFPSLFFKTTEHLFYNTSLFVYPSRCFFSAFLLMDVVILVFCLQSTKYMLYKSCKSIKCDIQLTNLPILY